MSSGNSAGVSSASGVGGAFLLPYLRHAHTNDFNPFFDIMQKFLACLIKSLVISVNLR